MTQESTSFRPGAILAAASAGAALILGVLYTLGAILITGALRAEHMSVATTLTTVPSQEFLARGVAAFVGSFGFMVFTVIWLAAATWQAVRWEQRRRAVRGLRTEIDEHRKKILALGDDPEAPELLDQLQALDDRLDRVEPPRPSKSTRTILWVSVAVALLVCGYARVVDVPWLLLVALLTALAASGEIPHVWLPILTSAVVYLSALIVAFYYPASLSPMRITTRSGAIVRGDLISQSAGHWYLASSAGRILVVPDDDVQRASIFPSGRPHYPRHVYAIVWSWFK